jgi:hypothetical protein
MYIFIKVFFKTNLFIYFLHLQTQQLKSYWWFIPNVDSNLIQTTFKSDREGVYVFFYGGRYALITTTFSATEYVYIGSLYMDLRCACYCYRKEKGQAADAAPMLQSRPGALALGKVNFASGAVDHKICTEICVQQKRDNIVLRQCLLPSKFQKFYKIPHHIKSLDVCLKH